MTSTDLTIDMPTFLRLYERRTAQIMWFLGAGASRSAGVKTAGDMIWDFKATLFRSELKLSPSAITDLGDPIVRRRLQAYFDKTGKYPKPDSEEEYAVYFEKTYPSPRDRRAYLDEIISKGKPTFGHMALGLLMKEKICNAIWTTNFDRTIEDASSKIFGRTGNLCVVDLAEPEKLNQAWSQNRWPIYAKLHGDYHSENLKNVSDELRNQDSAMRRGLIHACKSQGLAIIGYSGRDNSIMTALNEAVDNGKGFLGGLFWFQHSEQQPLPSVVQLIQKATNLGIEAYIVAAESFDEVFSDIIRFLPQTSNKLQQLEGEKKQRLVKTALRQPTTRLPVIRTNALPIQTYPVLCRRIECEVGGWKEIEAAKEAAQVNFIARRCRDGVIAFGRDADIKKAFANLHITTFDTYAVNTSRLEYENNERGLIRDGLFRAIGNINGLEVQRRGPSQVIIPDAEKVKPDIFNNAQRSIDALSGKIGTDVTWREACEINVDYRMGTLWLILQPRVLLNIPKEFDDVSIINQAKDFVRERMARRRNKEFNSILDGWINLILGEGNQSIALKAFGISDGIDAGYEILRTTGYSGS